MKNILVLLLLLAVSQLCYAEVVPTDSVTPPLISKQPENEAPKQPDLETLKQPTSPNQGDAEKFWSNFGAGLIMNFDLGHRKPVKSASIINSKVVVQEEDDTKYGLGIEAHIFATGNEQWGIGPYVAILSGTNEIIDAIGVGLIVGFFGQPEKDAKGKTISNKGRFSMNLLLGGYVDPKTQVLANGFKDGEIPPVGETTVRFKNVTQYGIQTGLSFNYGF